MRDDGWSTAEVAKMLGVGREALRYYEREGLVSPRRAGNSYRTYSYADYLQLLDIVEFRRSGMPLDEIKRLISVNSKEQNRQLFKERARAERELAERHRVLMEQFERADRAYEAIEQNLNLVTMRPLEPQYRVTRDFFLRYGGSGDIYEVEKFGDVTGEPRRLGGCLRLARSTAVARGLEGEVAGFDLVEARLCAFTIVCSEERSPSPEQVRSVADWAARHCFDPLGVAYARYIAASAEGYYIEVYLPVRESDKP